MIHFILIIDCLLEQNTGILKQILSLTPFYKAAVVVQFPALCQRCWMSIAIGQSLRSLLILILSLLASAALAQSCIWKVVLDFGVNLRPCPHLDNQQCPRYFSTEMNDTVYVLNGTVFNDEVFLWRYVQYIGDTIINGTGTRGWIVVTQIAPYQEWLTYVRDEQNARTKHLFLVTMLPS
jgi:hypothetical protein